MSDTKTLEAAFLGAFGAFWGEGTLSGFYGFFDADGLMVDEDMPVVLDKADFVDHCDFHVGGIWDWMEWKRRDVTYQVFGDTGVVACAFTYRGKVRDAGYRQRHGLMTLVAARDASSGDWRGVKLHLSPLLSHIHHGSPS